MDWVLIVLLALGVFFGLWQFAGFNRVIRQLLASALLIGIAGYAVQGRPGLIGKPVSAPASQEQSSGAVPAPGYATETNWLTIADSYQRSADKPNVVRILQAQLKLRPHDAELWAGFGAVLVMHADGMTTPAADLSFKRAARLDPRHPGPKFFHGLSLAQRGKPQEAERIWTELVAGAPADAAWRPMVEANLALLAQGSVAPAEGPR